MSPGAPTLARVLGHWSFDLLTVVLLGLAAGLYLYGVLRYDARRRAPWPRWRLASHVAGIATLAVALLSGLDLYADRLLSLHMVQHMLLLLLAPPLLLWGAPVRLALGALHGRARRRLAGVLASRAVAALTRPATGLAAFAAVVLGVHLTGFFGAALHDETLHELEHAAFFIAGLLFFAPLVAADPLPHAPGPLARFSWVMGGMVAMSIPGALLSFAHHVWYPYYAAPSRALGHSALTDQGVAGAVMWVGGGIAMFALSLVFAMQAMIGEERRQRRREAHLDAVAQGTRSL